MAIGPARMSLMEHLGELRMRLVRVIVCLIAATCVFYLSTGTVVLFLLAPVAEFMPTDGNGDVMLMHGYLPSLSSSPHRCSR